MAHSPPTKAALQTQIAGLAAHIAVLEAQLQTQETRTRILAAASRAFAEAGLDIQRVLDTVIREVAEGIGDNCVIRLLSADGRRLDPVASYHPDPEARAFLRAMISGAAYALGEGPSSNVIQTGAALLIPEVDQARHRQRIKPAFWPYLERFGVHSLLIVPLRVRGQVFGTLRISRDRPGHPYTPADQELLEELADRAALAIENARLYREVAEQRERFAVTLTSIGDAVIATDAAGRVTFMNGVAEALTGWTAAEAHGQDLTAVFPIYSEQTRAPLANPASQVIREGGIVGLANHTILRARDGTERPIDDSGAPIRGADGGLVGVVLVFRDISERRQTEAALRQSRDQLNSIVQSISEGITVQDRHAQLIYANDTAAQMLGFPSAEALVGRAAATVLQPFEVLDEAGNPFPPDRLPGRRAFLGQEGAEEVIGWRHRDSGEIRWSLVTAGAVRDDQGALQQVINIFRDITARKQAEDGQRFLAEASAVLAASLDVETTLRRVAALAVPALADWCGVDLVDEDGTLHPLAVAHRDPAKVAWAQELRQRYPPDPAAPSALLEVVRTGRAHLTSGVTDALLVAVARDPEHLALLQALGARSMLVVPLPGREGILGALSLVAAESGRQYGPAEQALAEELARRAALAIENARLYQAAQEAVQVRDQFLSIASHELKTPLTAIKGYAQVAQRHAGPGADARLLRNLRILNDQADRLTRLINDLLDVSRIQAGSLAFVRERFDLRTLVAELVSSLELTAPDLPLRLTLPAAPVPVEADPARLEQVVTNLVQNAIKYGAAGPQVEISLAAANGEAILAVRDWGIGIPADQQEQVFNRFFRGRNVSTGHYAGLGLGLFIAHGIVAEHGGRLWMDSTEGAGSTFYVALPLAADPQ